MAVSVRAVFPSGTTTALTGDGVTSLTQSVTVVSGDVLVAHGVVSDNTDGTFTLSATANANAADGSTAAVHANTQTAGYHRIFWWLAPAAGTYNVVLTSTGGAPDGLELKVLALAGTDNTAPTTTTFAPNDTTTRTAAAITSPTVATNGLGLAFYIAGSAFSSTGQTQLYVATNTGAFAAANDLAGSSQAGAGSTVSFTATISAADWYAAISAAFTSAATPLEVNQAAHWKQRPPGRLAPSVARPPLIGDSSVPFSPPANPAYFTSWADGTTPELIVNAEDWGVLANAGLNHSGNFNATYDDYLSVKAGQGYTSIYTSWCSFSAMSGGANGADSDGTFPFSTSMNPSTTPDSTFWGRRDHFISQAATNGIRVLLNITTPLLESGSPQATQATWTTTQWTNFGTFLAGRYSASPNIMWVVGDDYVGGHDTELSALLAALRAGGDTHPISIQNIRTSSSRREEWTGASMPWGAANAQFNLGYSYDQSYDIVEKMGLEANPIPYFWSDGYFLTMGLAGITDVQLMRRHIWWALSSGSKGFTVGDDDVWPWASTALAQLTSKTFYTTVMPAITGYFKSLPNWHLLVADTSSALVTGGRGTHVNSGTSQGISGGYYADDSDSYVTASRTPTGSLAVIYMSHGSTITIDETKLAAGYTATWVDPKSAATSSATPGSTYNSTAKGNNSDGQADWVLVLAAPVTNVSTGATIPLTDTITSTGVVGTASGSTLSQTVTITATGVVGKATGATISEAVAVTSAGLVGASTGTSLSETVTVTSAGVVATSTGSALSETVTITATGVVGTSSGAAIALTATISGTGGGAVSGGSTITETVTTTAAGAVGAATGAALSETVTTTSTGLVGVTGATTVGLTDTITSAGVVGKAGAATVGLTDAVTATGVVGRSTGATLSETVTITAAGSVTAVGTGSVAITETATITATGTMAAAGGSSLSETVTITAAGVVGKATGTSLSETFAVSSTGVVTKVGDAALTETVTITAAGSVTGGVGATINPTVAITATGVVGRSTGSSLSLSLTVQAAGVVSGAGVSTPAAHPRAVIVNNPHQAMMVANTHGGYVVDNIRQGDNSPPFTCVILDGTAPYDATGATSVVVKVWQDGVLLFSRAASSVTAGGVVTAAWQAGETDEPGPIKAVVQVTTAGKLSTFPPRGYLEAHISPLSPV